MFIFNWLTNGSSVLNLQSRHGYKSFAKMNFEFNTESSISKHLADEWREGSRCTFLKIEKKNALIFDKKGVIFSIYGIHFSFKI